MNLAIDRPWALAVALVVAALGFGVLRFELRRRTARLARLGPRSAVARLVPPDVLHSDASGRPWRLAAALLLAGVALAGPRWGAPSGTAEMRGIDVVFAIDVSLSMMAHDEQPTRLERAKQEARRLRAFSRGDRVALVAFAGRSYVLTPLTTDDGALALLLDNLDPSIVGQPGSALGPAIEQSMQLLEPVEGNDRALVLFTDGEAFDDRADVIAAARRAAEAGIAVVAIGFGGQRGSTILVGDAGRVSEKLDADGNVVITRYDRELMRALVDAAGGTLVDAEVTDKASRARAALAELKAQRRRVDSRRAIPLRYRWFLLPAVVLIAWDTIVVSRVASRRARAVAAATALALSVRAATGVGVWAAPVTAHAQASSLQRTAEREFLAARPIVAARLLRRAVAEGDRTPRTLYNLGTAYLAADSLDAAIEVLERVIVLHGSAVRGDALYNLGLAYLQRGRRLTGDAAANSFRRAALAYRAVLLSNPADSAARWNYELALREEIGASSSGGGGRGGTPPPLAEPESPTGALGREQAAQLLDAAAREESEVLRRVRQRESAPPPRGRDW